MVAIGKKVLEDTGRVPCRPNCIWMKSQPYMKKQALATLLYVVPSTERIGETICAV